MNNLFLIDLDHTLFDTELLKDFLKDKLLDILESELKLEDFHKTEKSRRNQPNYFQQLLIDFSNEYDQKEEKLKLLEDLFFNSDFSEFVFSDVADAISKLKSEGICWLFSTGDKKLQQAKLRHSQILSLFDDIKVFDNKLNHLPLVYAEYSQTHDIWFIDNYLEYLQNAHSKDPKIKTVFVNRYNFTNSVDFTPTLEVQTLTEFVDYLKNNEIKNSLAAEDEDKVS